MFDRITKNEITEVTREVTKNVSIVEKRAPTDESVRLLQEMQEKAKESILGHWVLEDNVFKAEWFRMADPHGLDEILSIRYFLNGIERKIKVRLCLYSGMNHNELLRITTEKVRMAICDDIARLITYQLFTEKGKEIRTLLNRGTHA